MDLDQAMHLERDGRRLRRALRDRRPRGLHRRPATRSTWRRNRRGETLYGADSKIPLHPTVLSEDAGSLLPGQVRPALLWTIEVDDDRRGHRRRRSSEPGCARAPSSTTPTVQQQSTPAPRTRCSAAAGGRRAAAGPRGGTGRRVLPLPEQEVDVEGGRWRLEFRTHAPVETWNAQISLLTGFAAASLMVYARVGLAAHPPAARPARRAAAAPHRPRARHRVARRAALPRLHPRPRPARARPRGDGRGVHPAAARQRVRRLQRRPARADPALARSPRSTPTSPRRCVAWSTATPARSASRSAPARRCRTGCSPEAA